ncbi:MAG: 50S ribosomal protein L10 [Nitrospiria bacterium]
MNKETKKASMAQLNEKFSRANVAVLADFSGMSVEEIREVKGRLRNAEGEFRVVKNTIAIRAAAGTSLDGVRDFFKGPTALVLGYADPVAPAKVLKSVADKQKKLKIKAGVVEDVVVDLDGFRRIAQLPSKTVLVAELVGRFQSPITGLAGSLHGVLGKFVRTLQAVHDQHQQS